jgi:cytoskeletal protein RodZ
MEEEKKGNSKLFLVVVLMLLGYASWYFFTQFDKKHLSGLIPFMDEQMIENNIAVEDKGENENLPVEDLSIESAVANNTKVVIEETTVENSVQETNQSDTPMVKELNDTITPVPVSQF